MNENDSAPARPDGAAPAHPERVSRCVVLDFLDDKGVDTTAYRRQATAVSISSTLQALLTDLMARVAAHSTEIDHPERAGRDAEEILTEAARPAAERDTGRLADCGGPLGRARMVMADMRPV
ncbi:hypothetical protein HD597_003755 [Nonomuraea thailandensis]|uniref:Uncharacterized protein n=1 Tax=Nonomuraea thailandensis TaxID=1188745 RepID=A0A9X2GFK2_9ACTN|nr:hypothetical protein [Nonomuraea thailandensis]MCP2356735.1 hypothetical protein [Nonomuraea thailandensis]